jgi:hypothetical protein
MARPLTRRAEPAIRTAGDGPIGAAERSLEREVKCAPLRIVTPLSSGTVSAPSPKAAKARIAGLPMLKETLRDGGDSPAFTIDSLRCLKRDSNFLQMMALLRNGSAN